MSLIKPKAVLPGATFGIVSPASTPQAERVAAGIAELERMGYKSKMFPSALKRGPLYYAGTAAERAADFHAAYLDDEVDAVLCTRGGWGSAELLPLLDRELIHAHAKLFLGYSDQTSLHLWLRNEVGLASLQAPMLAADFSKAGGVHLPSWRAALEGSASWSVGADEGLRVMQTGVAEGEFHGGCVSIYAESLGTPYSAKPCGGILFLEDVGVKPYQWDRMLVHLHYAGMLEGLGGIIFGDMQQCVSAGEMPTLEAALRHALRDFCGPIAVGLRSGHVDFENVTLPLGVRTRLICNMNGTARLEFLEAAVV